MKLTGELVKEALYRAAVISCDYGVTHYDKVAEILNKFLENEPKLFGLDASFQTYGYTDKTGYMIILNKLSDTCFEIKEGLDLNNMIKILSFDNAEMAYKCFELKIKEVNNVNR